jgi:acetyltransferase-like isoleucine patch superfamily enzyme
MVLLPYHVLGSMVSYFPGPLGYPMRRLWWRFHVASMGQQVLIEPGVVIMSPKEVFIGHRVHLDRGVILVAGHRTNDPRVTKTIRRDEYPHKAGQIHIGHDIHIAPYAILVGQAGILLGHASSIAAHACLYSASHHHKHGSDVHNLKKYLFSNRVADSDQSLIVGPVVVEPHAGVGMHACVLPGTLVRTGVCVPAGSVVRGVVE